MAGKRKFNATIISTHLKSKRCEKTILRGSKGSRGPNRSRDSKGPSGQRDLKETLGDEGRELKKLKAFSNFSCIFLNPNYFFQFEYM